MDSTRGSRVKRALHVQGAGNNPNWEAARGRPVKSPTPFRTPGAEVAPALPAVMTAPPPFDHGRPPEREQPLVASAGPNRANR